MKDLYSKLNFFAASFISIVGITMLYEVFAEDDFEDKVDDAFLAILGLFAIWWYKKSGYAGKNPKLAITVVGLSSLIKIMAIAIEHADKEAVGDDIGILMAFILAFIFILWQSFSKKS